MREIKFRAWIVDEEKYYYNVQNTYDYIDLFNTGDEPAPYMCFGDMLNDENIILEQYTGLKDKDGVEIYEGDIVKNYFYDGGKENKLGRVKSIEIVIYENGMFKFKDCEDMPIGYDNLRGCSFIEIIGNIHENGDLVE